MSKKMNLLMSALLSLVLCLSSFAPALAADAIIGTENAPAKAAITKLLRLPEGTATPSASFTFKVTAKSVDGVAATASNMPIIGDKTVSYTAADTGTPSNHIITLPKETGDIFNGVVFPHAGIYEYEVQEAANTNTLDPAHETMTYSAAKYTVTVYVKDGSKGTYIYAISALNTVDDNGDAVDNGNGYKVDPTPGGDPTVPGDYSDMAFTNNYVKTNGSDTPDNPDPTKPNESTLNVSKTVSGDFASTSIYFEFKLKITVPAALIPSLGGNTVYKAYVVENNTVVGSSIDFQSGMEKTIQLKHGQKLMFVNTPVGTVYDVTEIGTSAYTPAVEVTTNGGAPVSNPSNETITEGGSLAALGQLVGEATNLAAYTNSRDNVTPTGINLSTLPYVGLVLMAFGALVMFVIVKSRKKETQN